MYAGLIKKHYLCAGVPSPGQRYDILLTLLSEMENSLSDMQIQQLATVTHGFVGADLAALCNEAALVCLRRYVKFKKSCDDFHCNRTSIVHDGKIADPDDSEALEDQFSRDHPDCASSSPPDLSVSSENLPYFGVQKTTSNRTNNIWNGVDASVRRSFIMEEECMLVVTFEDFEKARMRIRPSAMREVCLIHPYYLQNQLGNIYIMVLGSISYDQSYSTCALVLHFSSILTIIQWTTSDSGPPRTLFGSLYLKTLDFES